MIKTVTTRSHRAHRALAILALASMAGAAQAQYIQRNLVSDQPGQADHTDAALLNPWGIAFNPAGFVWVSNNHSGKSTLYDGNGVPQSLIVDIPSLTTATGGSPTGITFYGGAGFTTSAGNPARFIFAGEDGTISAWAPADPAPPPSTQAHRVVITSGGASYKGVSVGGERLFAANFAQGKVDSFDNGFAPLSLGFTDPTVPAGMAPFNVKAVGSNVYVAYAQIDPATGDEVKGAGLGQLDVFNSDGILQKRLVAPGGALNAPWGMAIAPSDFGALSGALLVGNFGDGKINGYDPVTGAFLGALKDASGQDISIDGLWGIDFGNDLQSQPHNTLFFAAGVDDESHGLYGRLDLIPAPGAASLALFAALGGMTRRRRA